MASSRRSANFGSSHTRQTVYFFGKCKYPFVVKPMVVTEPAVPNARLLVLGTKLYPSKMHILN